MTCDLCNTLGGRLLWQDDRVRVVYVDEPGFAGYCRVVWQKHVAEMTDLDEASRAHCMRVVFAVESLLRERIKPDKVNLASLGNLTPHVHWHVIARFHDDSHFPQAIWPWVSEMTPISVDGATVKVGDAAYPPRSDAGP